MTTISRDIITKAMDRLIEKDNNEEALARLNEFLENGKMQPWTFGEDLPVEVEQLKTLGRE